ncbi:MAG TPA: tRNA methyltransferase, partial [Pyrodictium sp.]|nr:tRNA methyltransferase [Pyrodictium sp.]
MILIHRKSGKTFYAKDITRDFSTHLGIIKAEDLSNLKNGDIIKSHLGEEFIYLEDSFIDKILFIKRGPQITHQKDIGLLISLTGLSSGWKVVEGGSGSGYMTAFLANIVKPNGKIYSYEKRDDFYTIAKKNLEFLGLSDYVVLKNRD